MCQQSGDKICESLKLDSCAVVEMFAACNFIKLIAHLSFVCIMKQDQVFIRHGKLFRLSILLCLVTNSDLIIKVVRHRGVGYGNYLKNISFLLSLSSHSTSFKINELFLPLQLFCHIFGMMFLIAVSTYIH